MRGLVFDLETVPIKLHPFYDTYFSINEKLALDEELKKYEKLAIDRGQVDPFVSHPPFNAVVAIAWALVDDNDGKIVVRKRGGTCSTDEKTLIENFVKFINENKPDVYIHFNGKNFDVPMVIWKSIFYNLKITHKKFTNLYKYTHDNHFDLKDVVSHYGIFPINLRTLSLSLKEGDPKEDCSGEDVARLWKKKSYSEIEAYCKKDVEKTTNSFKKLYPLISAWK